MPYNHTHCSPLMCVNSCQERPLPLFLFLPRSHWITLSLSMHLFSGLFFCLSLSVNVLTLLRDSRLSHCFLFIYLKLNVIPCIPDVETMLTSKAAGGKTSSHTNVSRFSSMINPYMHWMTVLLSFTLSHVVPNLYDLLSPVKQKSRRFVECLSFIFLKMQVDGVDFRYK